MTLKRPALELLSDVLRSGPTAKKKISVAKISPSSGVPPPAMAIDPAFSAEGVDCNPDAELFCGCGLFEDHYDRAGQAQRQTLLHCLKVPSFCFGKEPKWHRRAKQCHRRFENRIVPVIFFLDFVQNVSSFCSYKDVPRLLNSVWLRCKRKYSIHQEKRSLIVNRMPSVLYGQRLPWPN
jgi:hypothetical protein